MIARKPLQIFLAVQKALFLREVINRLTTTKSKLFWTFYESFQQVLIMVAIKMLIFGSLVTNFDFTVFLALNFIAYYLFVNIIKSTMKIHKIQKGIYLYKQINLINILITKILIEVFISSIIFIIFLSIGAYFNYDIEAKNIPMVVLGILWLIVFASSLGLFLGIANYFYPTVAKIINIVLRILMFTSALFYTLDMLPKRLQVIQDILLYNPLIHFMEMIHGYYFHALDDSYVDYHYMLLWTVPTLFIGLWLYTKLQLRITSL